MPNAYRRFQRRHKFLFLSGADMKRVGFPNYRKSYFTLIYTTQADFPMAHNSILGHKNFGKASFQLVRNTHVGPSFTRIC